MKNLTLIVTILAAVAGCSVLNDIGRYAQDNPAMATIATRQAVFRYIDAGATDEEKSDRAMHVLQVVDAADTFLIGNPKASVAELIEVVNRSIMWHRLSPADRMLIEDIMLLTRASLEQKQEEGLLDSDAIVGLRGIIQVVRSTAAIL